VAEGEQVEIKLQPYSQELSTKMSEKIGQVLVSIGECALLRETAMSSSLARAENHELPRLLNG
jgi:hypothetical protein